MTATAGKYRWRQTSADLEDGGKSINLSTAERTISIATGVKLALSGFKGLFKSPFSSIIKLGAGGYLLNRGITGHCDLYQSMGRNTTEPVNVNIRSSFLIDKPRQEIYDFWRQLNNLPLFMKHLESVEIIDDKRSHWVLKLPANVAKVSWDAEIVKDEPGYMIGWSSLPESLIDNAGKVRFEDAPDGKGTLVDVVISYRPPAGGFGGTIAHVLNPIFKNLVDNDVRNFKQYMDAESAEVYDRDADTDGGDIAAIVIEETVVAEPTWQNEPAAVAGQDWQQEAASQDEEPYVGNTSNLEADKQSPYSTDRGQQASGAGSVI